jgi:hypothetical protein
MAPFAQSGERGREHTVAALAQERHDIPYATTPRARQVNEDEDPPRLTLHHAEESITTASPAPHPAVRSTSRRKAYQSISSPARAPFATSGSMVLTSASSCRSAFVGFSVAAGFET